MNIRTWWLAGLVAISIASVTSAQPAPEPTPAPAQPPVTAAPGPAGRGVASDPVESAAMPAERIERPTLLDEQIEAIRAAVPGFNSVIVRDPGVAANYPMLPPMTLKNVTIGQFLRFVEEAFPGVQCRRIEGPQGSIFAIRINSDEGAMRRAQLAEDAGRVRFFRLGDIVRALAAESGSPSDERNPIATTNKTQDQRIKEATEHVLSLLQTALDQTEPQESYTMKLHEPTLTLLFKGSATKQAVLEDALATLSPRMPWESAGRRPAGAGRGMTYDTYVGQHGVSTITPLSQPTDAVEYPPPNPLRPGQGPAAGQQIEPERMANWKMDQQQRAQSREMDALGRKYEAEVLNLRAKLAELQRAATTTKPTKD